MGKTSWILALALAGCAGGPSAEERTAAQRRTWTELRREEAMHREEARFRVDLGLDIRGLPTPSSPLPAAEPDVFQIVLRALVKDLQPSTDFERWTELVACADDDEIIGAIDPSALPEQAIAIAQALVMSKSAAAEKVLVAIALRPDHPPEAVESLYSYFKMRGGDKQPPATLPDAKLLEYVDHPTARGRAALAWLGRAVRDPALFPALERLAHDPDFEVRRAAALALANGPDKTPRSKEDAAAALATIFKTKLIDDPDPHVVVATCRALSTYDDATAVKLLVAQLAHDDFNVRVAALEGLGKRKAKDPATLQTMELLARKDASTSVRYTAAEQLAEIDVDAAQKLVDGLLADPSEYVRSAGVDILAKSEDLTANPRLATIAKNDPHVRVRETAVGAFEGKKDSQIAEDAIRAALADKDVGIVSTACGVVAKNEWIDLADSVVAVPARFPGCLGADAREAAVSAVADLIDVGRRMVARATPPNGSSEVIAFEHWDPASPRTLLFKTHLQDANPAVRAAAENAVAKLDKKDPPKTPTRGADLTGELLPGGAPIFERDVFLVVETNKGTMKIRLFPEQAPVHCAHVAALARTHFYDGLTWHRVVPDFVIQGGCPRGDGSGNAGVTLPLEPTTIPFERGTLGMPRSEHPDTGGCQLFICHSRAPHLDVRYTAFGKVVEGLDVIDKIDVDDKIVRVTVEGAR